MNAPQLKALKNNDILRKRLAKLMAKFCFRDTKLEELHDRISDEEMKALMIDCANHCYALVCMLFATQGGNDLIDMLKEHDQVPHWDDPGDARHIGTSSKAVPALRGTSGARRGSVKSPPLSICRRSEFSRARQKDCQEGKAVAPCLCHKFDVYARVVKFLYESEQLAEQRDSWSVSVIRPGRRIARASSFSSSGRSRLIPFTQYVRLFQQQS
jgi:hypothetical protein